MVQVKVKILKKWKGMSCVVCARGQVDGENVVGCDLGQDAHNDCYCMLFVPHEGRIPRKRDIVRMVEDHVQGSDLWFLGEPRVNVMELNLALQQLGG